MPSPMARPQKNRGRRDSLKGLSFCVRKTYSYMNRYMAMTKKVMYTSMVAMRVWTKCMKSKASSQQPRVDNGVLRVIRLQNTYMTGHMAMPNRVPTMRQPKGFMPKIRMPSPMSSLPSGGWVFS